MMTQVADGRPTGAIHPKADGGHPPQAFSKMGGLDNVGDSARRCRMPSRGGWPPMAFGIFAALADFERELIIERTKAGMAAARARGRNGARPYKIAPSKLRLAVASMNQPETKQPTSSPACHYLPAVFFAAAVPHRPRHGSPPFGHAPIVAWAARWGSADVHDRQSVRRTRYCSRDASVDPTEAG
jgi:hypothetical protein